MTQPGGSDPSDPLRPVGPLRGDGVNGASATQAADGAAAADGVEATSAVDPAAATDEVRGTDAIADALEAGAIDAEAARARLIEDALAAHLPADADPAVVEAVRADIEAALADDPTLDRLLRRA